MVLPDSDGVSRVPPYSGYWAEETKFRLQGYHLLWLIFPNHSTTSFLGNSNVQSYNPREQALWFGLFPFRSCYSGNRIFFLFLWVLRCFSSPRLPSTELCIHSVITGLYSCWVSPFGNLRITVYLQLPEAYRS